MNADEVRGDVYGDGSPTMREPCEEGHYTRFLYRILPGPERAKGSHVCLVCGQYFELSDLGIKVKIEHASDYAI